MRTSGCVVVMCWTAFVLVSPACSDDEESVFSGEVSEEQLTAVCESYCEAAYAGGCDSGAQSLSTCKSQCPIQAQELQGVCTAELANQYVCLARSDFRCVEGVGPMPSGAECMSQAQAFEACGQDFSCKLFCGNLIEQGCSADESSCIDGCRAERADFDKKDCGRDYDSLLNCWGGAQLSCEQDTPVAEGICARFALDTAECLHRESEDLCDAWCWAADTLGCGDGCVADCASQESHLACGESYKEVLLCGLSSSDTECSGTLIAAGEGCEDEVEAHAECLASP